jgi:hypothetical protein
MAMSSTRTAEIGAIADGVDLYRSRVAGLAEPLTGTPKEDLLAALYEAERSLRTAYRALRRAADLSR